MAIFFRKIGLKTYFIESLKINKMQPTKSEIILVLSQNNQHFLWYGEGSESFLGDRQKPHTIFPQGLEKNSHTFLLGTAKKKT